MTREEEAGGQHSERHQRGPSRRQSLTPLWFLMCITRITRRAPLTGAPRNSARSRHTAPAPLLYLLHPSRFSESTGCLWLAKAYLPTPEGISTWVGPRAPSGKPPLDSVQTQKCQESEISTSSRWQLNAPSTLAWVDGKLPRVPQTKASLGAGGPRPLVSAGSTRNKMTTRWEVAPALKRAQVLHSPLSHEGTALHAYPPLSPLPPCVSSLRAMVC